MRRMTSDFEIQEYMQGKIHEFDKDSKSNLTQAFLDLH